MRIGILGTGFGQYHAKMFASFPEVEVIGIVGRDERKTMKAADSVGITGYTTPDALLQNPDIDAIDVCYPTSIHAEYVIRALEQGKHVFCETPVAYTLKDAEQMVRTAQACNKLLLVALFDRFQSEYRYVYEYIHAGHLGSPKAAFANRRTPAIWGNLAENIVLDLMIHDIDYLSWLLGIPRAVTARGLKNPTAGWDQVFVSLEFENINAMVEGCGIMPESFPFSTQLQVVCEEGALDVNWSFPGEHPVSDITLYPQKGDPQKLSIPGYDPYQAECRYFVDCIQGKADPGVLGIEAAYDSLRVALAAKASLEQQGKRITL